MHDALMLISSQKIETADFMAFMADLGALSDDIYDGVVYKAKQNVWISKDPWDIYYKEGNLLEFITSKLGAEPQTYILIDVAKESGQLGLEIIHKFVEKWDCILDNNCGINECRKFFTREEVLAQNEANRHSYSCLNGFCNKKSK